jgi:hypothetical protein
MTTTPTSGANASAITTTTLGESVNVAYADPPYLGCCGLYGHHHPITGHPWDGMCWDRPVTHALLIDWLRTEYRDGWALSMSSPSLRQLLHLCPDDVRVSPWVKPFAVYKPNVNPAYVWEPVVWRGGRQKRARTEPTVRDWHSEVITLRKGLTGAKPESFVLWLFDLLGVQENDTVTDLFPGTGVVGATFARWQRYKGSLPPESSLFDPAVDPVAGGTTA